MRLDDEQYVPIGFDFVHSRYAGEIGFDVLGVYIVLRMHTWRSATKGQLAEYRQRGLLASRISIEEIADLTGQSKAWVKTAIQSLRDLTWISTESNGHGLTFILGEMVPTRRLDGTSGEKEGFYADMCILDRVEIYRAQQKTLPDSERDQWPWRPSPPPSPLSKPSRTIYFVSTPERDRIKIGSTAYLTSRVQQLRSSVGMDLHLLAHLPGSYKIEREIHKRFSEERIPQSEWFRASSRLLQYINEVQSNKTSESQEIDLAAASMAKKTPSEVEIIDHSNEPPILDSYIDKNRSSLSTNVDAPTSNKKPSKTKPESNEQLQLTNTVTSSLGHPPYNVAKEAWEASGGERVQRWTEARGIAYTRLCELLRTFQEPTETLTQVLQRYLRAVNPSQWLDWKPDFNWAIGADRKWNKVVATAELEERIRKALEGDYARVTERLSAAKAQEAKANAPRPKKGVVYGDDGGST